MNQEIQHWMETYEEEIERKELEIYNMKLDRDQMIEKLEDLKVLYEKHAIEIEEYLAYKEEKRIREELFAAQTEASTIIQAWWRGMQVKYQLGPFKKKKGKGKNKGKKK